MTVVWRGCVFLLALPLFSYVNKEPQIRRLLKTHIPGTSETPFRFKKTVMRSWLARNFKDYLHTAQLTEIQFFWNFIIFFTVLLFWEVRKPFVLWNLFVSIPSSDLQLVVLGGSWGRFNAVFGTAARQQVGLFSVTTNLHNGLALVALTEKWSVFFGLAWQSCWKVVGIELLTSRFGVSSGEQSQTVPSHTPPGHQTYPYVESLHTLKKWSTLGFRKEKTS